MAVLRLERTRSARVAKAGVEDTSRVSPCWRRAIWAKSLWREADVGWSSRREEISSRATDMAFALLEGDGFCMAVSTDCIMAFSAFLIEARTRMSCMDGSSGRDASTWRELVGADSGSKS